ncbi:DNA-formamidopyrimidine glycosylase family protein [Candidatus Coxiella mudrowiae]|uniref:DNA-formamidopyrimidine glycosylase family protein n=1 Tax=Candidatus Coxiella mudrowiae TaxID=2054173 RepID=UPI0006627E27|nr:DNA-formamidopyrimidine glycosylase family protein [Candidatus Coxiella mudrowiae]
MPELPEIETYRAGLAPHLEGLTIHSISIFRRDLRYPTEPKLNKLLGILNQINRRGKYLLFHVSKKH